MMQPFKNLKIWKYSIRKILFFLAVLLLLIIITGITYIQKHQRQALLHQAAQSQSQLISSFLSRMDDNLEKIETQLYTVLYNDSQVETLNHSADEVAQYRAKEAVANSLDQTIQLSEFVECAWFYSPQGTEAEFLSRNNYTGITLKELVAMEDTLIELLDDSTENPYLQSDQWTILSVLDTDYLIWMTPVNGAYCGLWFSSSYLFQMLEALFPDRTAGDLLLCSSKGDILLQTGQHTPTLLSAEDSYADTDGDYITIWNYSENADIAVETFLAKQPIVQNQFLRFDYAWACALLLFFVLLAFLLFQVLIFRPLQRLLHQIGQIGTGDLKEKLPIEDHLLETVTLRYSINRLLGQIQLLNSQVYEAQIRERDIQCQYLQVRLKTHFYMNCLSIIHAMARMQRTDLIQELSTCLVNYLRFAKDDSDKYVRLAEEMEHVRNYARIQELRFPDLFEFQEEIPMELYDASIPPLMLQTFIENSVEHGMKRGVKNWVHVAASYHEQNQKPGISFVIEDNGKGFSEEELEDFKKDPATFDLSKTHGIGIRNVISRLGLLYAGKAAICFANRKDGGAVISIWIPFLETEEEEHV